MTFLNRWICSQIGAREHYAIARALRQKGRLQTLYTDFWAGPVIRGAGRFKITALRSLAARYHDELENVDGRSNRAEIISWNFQALVCEMKLRRQRSRTSNQYEGFIEVGRKFATRVREDLKRRSEIDSDFIFFSYDTGALESLEWCREQGIKSILNQMDPNRVEVDLVRAEEKQWPGWAPDKVEVPEEYFVRREQEWALADRVLVNSEFSRQALLQQGVPVEKLVVIPLCYEKKAEAGRQEVGSEKEFQVSDFRFSVSSPLRVLFLGQVILRKGIQYLMAAAKMLEQENIHFDVVGSVGISDEAVTTAPCNLTFHGRKGRDETAGWYQRSQVFVLPTISDGFALTQLEAMAYGLPVVTTPCCGEVVADGVDGFVVPPRDVTALVQVFQRFLGEPELLRRQSTAARIKARQFTLERLSENLQQVEVSIKS